MHGVYLCVVWIISFSFHFLCVCIIFWFIHEFIPAHLLGDIAQVIGLFSISFASFCGYCCCYCWCFSVVLTWIVRLISIFTFNQWIFCVFIFYLYYIIAIDDNVLLHDSHHVFFLLFLHSFWTWVDSREILNSLVSLQRQWK